MFVRVNRTGFGYPRSQSMAKLGSLLRWSLAFTLCLLGSLAFGANEAQAESGAVASGTTVSAPTAGATGEAWLPPAAASTSASGQVTTTTTAGATGQVTSTPPTAPAPAMQGSRAAPNEDAAADADPEALTLFQADLEPYGAWLDDPRYGRIWVPNRDMVGSGFSPYVTAGHWSLDGDDNWVWVSDYPFGDIVFHYGRWFYSAEHGWAWVPGRTYAPSWVVWRTPTSSSYAYVGWAPMPPRFGWFSTGVVWYSTMPPVSYVFCPSDYLFYPSVGVYIVHDPWLVGRLGLYTSFYYPPYGYYGWGYYGYGYGGMGYHHTHNYGPPVHRTGIAPRAIPRERIAARPRVAATRAATGAGMAGSRASLGARSSARFGAAPAVGSPRRTTSLGTSAAPRRSTSSWTAPRTSPLARSGAMPAAGPRTTAVPRSATSGFSPRSSSPSFSPRSSGASSWSAPRSSSTFSSSPRSASPSFHSSPSFRSPSSSSSPSFHSSPSFRSSPSFHSSPSFRSGGRHR